MPPIKLPRDPADRRQVGPNGTVSVGGKTVGQHQLVDVPAPSGLLAGRFEHLRAHRRERRARRRSPARRSCRASSRGRRRRRPRCRHARRPRTPTRCSAGSSRPRTSSARWPTSCGNEQRASPRSSSSLVPAGVRARGHQGRRALRDGAQLRGHARPAAHPALTDTIDPSSAATTATTAATTAPRSPTPRPR